jgi:hypothetical protein
MHLLRNMKRIALLSTNLSIGDWGLFLSNLQVQTRAHCFVLESYFFMILAGFPATTL